MVRNSPLWYHINPWTLANKNLFDKGTPTPPGTINICYDILIKPILKINVTYYTYIVVYVANFIDPLPIIHYLQMCVYVCVWCVHIIITCNYYIYILSCSDESIMVI